MVVFESDLHAIYNSMALGLVFLYLYSFFFFIHFLSDFLRSLDTGSGNQITVLLTIAILVPPPCSRRWGEDISLYYFRDFLYYTIKKNRCRLNTAVVCREKKNKENRLATSRRLKCNNLEGIV